MPLSHPSSDGGRKWPMAFPTAVSALSAAPRKRRSMMSTTMLMPE